MDLLSSKHRYEVHPETLKELKQFASSNKSNGIRIRGKKLAHSNYYRIDVIFDGFYVGLTCNGDNFRENRKNFFLLLDETNKKHPFIKV